VPEHVVGSKPPLSAEDKEKIKRSDWILAWATIVIAIGTIVSAAAVISQWREMVASGRQTDEIIEAARINAEAAQENAKSARDFATSANSINQRIGAAERDFARMSNSSEAAITAARKNMQEDERAWLVVDHIEGMPQLGKPFSISTQIRNTGRSPAVNVTHRIAFAFIPQTQDFIPSFQPLALHSRLVLGSGNSSLASLDVSGGKDAVQADLDRFKTEKLFVWGKVCYEDVFKMRHWLHFCVHYVPEDRDWKACDTYNDQDSDTSGQTERCDATLP
jgi:hypothetical protein